MNLCGALARVGTGAHLIIILCSLGPRKLGAAILLTAILGPFFLQCGQGGRKGPDGHGSELGNSGCGSGSPPRMAPQGQIVLQSLGHYR